MKNNKLLMVNFIFIVTVIFYTVLTARGNPIESTPLSSTNEYLTARYSGNYSNVENATQKPNCNPVEYELTDVTILENNDLCLNAKNVVIPSSEYQKKNGKIFTCVSSNKEDKPSGLKCCYKFDYEQNEFLILPNRSALLEEHIIPEEEYELKGNILRTCAPEEEGPAELTLQEVSIYVGQAGSIISIISLTAHLLTFIFVPALRNLPGYNLASLSVAFLLAYFFVLFGQIPEILGLSCVISAILQQNFFLAAFFWTNVLAFDVWRTLKLAIKKLAVGSEVSRKRQFTWYSLYAWGLPLVITTISVIVDNTDNVLEKVKPDYGKHDVCWMDNINAKVAFFVVPAFALLLVNAVFFVMSSWMIASNTMKVTNDQSKQNVKLNYILYVRLALMMGLTWLLGIIAILWRNDVMWFIFDFLNSLQGLFLFLLFTCTKKVLKQLAMKSNVINLLSLKQSTVMSNSTSASTKTDSSK